MKRRVNLTLSDPIWSEPERVKAFVKVAIINDCRRTAGWLERGTIVRVVREEWNPFFEMWNVAVIYCWDEIAPLQTFDPVQTDWRFEFVELEADRVTLKTKGAV